MQQNDNGWGSNGSDAQSPNETKNNINIDVSSFMSILSSQSLMAGNNGILELKDIKESLTETLKSQRSTAAAENVRSIIPKLMDMSPEQSQHLPGIILYAINGSSVCLMPVLFYKKDIAQDALETINLGNNSAPQTYHKFAEAFMTDELRQKVISAFGTIEGKQMSRQFVVSNKVVDVDMFIQSSKETEAGVIAIAQDILNEWYNAINNFSIMAVAATDPSKMPNVFHDSHLLGQDDNAVARIDTVQHPFTLDGRPVPYNLQVKLATAPKGNIHSQNFNAVKTVANTFLNVSLEVMSQDMYHRALMANPSGIGIGPLVPVISLGKTIPGEQLRNNHSIMADMLGMYTQLGANSQVFFSEAYRQAEVGARGNISNLAQIAYQVSGRQPQNNNEILTPKSLSNQAIVMKFIQQYVAQRAVFVLDIPRYSERPANAEFWWNLLTHKNGTSSSYYKAFLMMLDKLSNGQFSARGKKAMDDKNNNVWKPGDDILIQTPVIIPVGTAKGRHGIFSLEEVDQMLLRDPLYYANNEQAIAQYASLQNGSSGKELRVRQYEMKKALEFLFSGNVSLVGWKSRWRFSDKFLNSFAGAMTGAGNITVTSNNATQIWENQISNDYLMSANSAVLVNQGGGVAAIGGVYTGWN